ncbi:hypothetical protein M1446_05330 [Candidatus Dependentiae bacterium]|nr:hypothetical protein [Candidatus Dependentiae bacterium]
MFKKFIFLFLSIICIQTNCWKEIVPKSERFPLQKLPVELIEKILIPKFPEDEISADEYEKELEDYKKQYKLMPQDKKDKLLVMEKFQIHHVSNYIFEKRKDLVENYLKNLSKTNHFFNLYSKEVLQRFDNKFVRFMNECFINPGKLETSLREACYSCKCQKFHNHALVKKLIDAGADIRQIMSRSTL